MKSDREKTLKPSSGFVKFLRRARVPLFLLAGVLLVGLIVIPRTLSAAAPVKVTEIAAATDTALEAQAQTATATELSADNAAAIAPDSLPEQPDATMDAGSEYAELAFGATDPMVVSIQERLMELGYMDSDEPTDYFGPATEAALKRFQRVHYMLETGVADPLTQSILFSESARIYVIAQGDEGEDVAMMQERLEELGYYNDKTNGYFGTATSRALSAFKAKNSLTSDGTADQDTRDLLYSPRAKPKVDPTPTPKPKPSATPKPSSTPKASNAGNNQTASPEKTSPQKTSSGSLDDYGEASASGLIDVAKTQLGEPYVWSQEGPDSFDCSGLVYYSLRCIGVSVGRLSASGFAEVSSWSTINSVGELKAGDLIFFKSDSSTRISHTGIWLGGNKYIHASSSAGKVIISSWSNWAERNFMMGKRVF